MFKGWFLEYDGFIEVLRDSERCFPGVFLYVKGFEVLKGSKGCFVGVFLHIKGF